MARPVGQGMATGLGGDPLEADIGQLIAAVKPESIAEELGIQPGDRLLAIDEQPVRDIFDYQTRQTKEQVLLTIRKADGEVLLLDIEKDEDEDLGLDFANPMLDDCRNCHNRCVFCFIDQLPEGMRPSMYLKDDDLRLSFLSGNYVTLTNITSEELDRIIDYRFSPLNISVHATDADVRRRMMRNRHAGDLMPAMRRIAAAGIRINAQIVLVPGYNDGAVLEQTVNDLAELMPAIQSIAVVPVGMTRYRSQNKLVPLQPVGPAEARAVLSTVHSWQQQFLARCGSRVLYAADEFYLIGGHEFPPAETYEGYPQLENGVGMWSLFQDELARGLQDRSQPGFQVRAATELQKGSLPERVVLVTGTAAGPLLQEAAAGLSACYGTSIEALIVANRFFGETITVAGLLTGQDIRDALIETQHHAWSHQNVSGISGTVILIPENQLRSGTRMFLDDETVESLKEQTGLTILTTAPDAGALLRQLDGLTGKEAVPMTPESPLTKGDVLP